MTNLAKFDRVDSFCIFVGCGRVFEAHQFQSRRVNEHHKRSWPGWSSWPSSLFGSVLQMSKSAKLANIDQIHSSYIFVGCGRVFEAHQFQSGRATEHRKRSWPGWSSWPSSLFGSVLQMSKSAKLANIDQIHSSYIFVGCGRVFEAHQFQSGRATEHRKRSWPGWSSWPSSLFGSVLQMSKSAKLANIDQIHSSYIFVGCGRVFESHQNNLKS